MRIVLFSIIFTMFVILGCGTNWTTENPNPDTEILEAMITPTQVEAESVVDVAITARIKLAEIFADKEKYAIKLFSETGDEFEIFDDGKHNDNAANDGIYGALFPQWQAPVTVGMVKFEIRTFFKQNVLMHSKMVQIEVLEKKEPPVIESFEITPAEIEVKLEHELTFTAQISDPNGLDDIATVTVNLKHFGGDKKQEMTPEPEAGEGFYTYKMEKYLAPDEVQKLAALVTVTDTANMKAKKEAEITTYPTPNHAPSIEKVMVTPKRIYFDTTINIVMSINVFDEEGYNDIKSVMVDLSSLGLEANQPMYDDGRHYDNIFKDGKFGYYVKRFTPVRESRKYEIKFKVTDSKGDFTEVSEYVVVVDPATLDNTSNPTLDDTDETEAPDEIKDKFRSMFDGMTTSVFVKESGEEEEKIQSTRIIINEENSWDPEISGYVGYRESGMKLVMPVSWKISRRHMLDVSNWKIEFPFGHINIEMLPFKIGDDETLNNKAKEYQEEIVKKYNEKMETGEILNLNYDGKLYDYKRFLNQKAIWFDLYVVSKESENVTHSVYMFYAKEATSNVNNPIYRTFKVEFVRIPAKFKTKAFEIFVDNFSVN